MSCFFQAEKSQPGDKAKEGHVITGLSMAFSVVHEIIDQLLEKTTDAAQNQTIRIKKNSFLMEKKLFF